MSIKNPNKPLWQQYDRNSQLRGELAVHLLKAHIDLSNSRVLDVGCGNGGIALSMHEAGARVTAIDPALENIAKLEALSTDMETRQQSAEDLNDNTVYDIIILNDVLEHVQNPGLAIRNCSQALKPGGLLYLLTPNKHSLINLFCDPHYSLPLVAVFSRHWVRFVVANILKWHNPAKPDFPQLLSLKQLRHHLEHNALQWRFINRQAAELALEQPAYIWSRRWHIRVIKAINRFKIQNLFLTFIHNKPDFINRHINPAFYILAEKNEK